MTPGPVLLVAPGNAARGLLAFAGRAMGSPLRLTVVSNQDSVAVDRAARAWRAVRDEFEASEQAMSRFRDTSEATLLNRGVLRNETTAVSRRLAQALVACDRAHRLTEGRFDPRVLRDLERLGDRGAWIGEAARVDGNGARSGNRIVERDGVERIRLIEPVDLGGIGKGLAVRWAAARVRGLGLDAFLLDAGGDLTATGTPPEGGPWRIGIEDPRGGTEPLAVVTAHDEALATSSVRRRHWTAGDRTVHHLIDPRTGEPGGEGLLAVTVAGTDPAWSEVWSKSLFIEGRVGVAELARRLGLAAWWVTVDGVLEMTPAARMRTLWTASDGERA